MFKIFIKKTLITLFAFASWVGIFLLIWNMIIFFNTVHYQPNATPDSKFKVVIINTNGEHQAVYFHKLEQQKVVDFVNQNQSYGEDFLIKDNDILTYHNEGALWYTKSRYKIVNQQIQPVSFLLFTFFEPFVALFLSIIGYTVAKYVFLRFWYRHSSEKISQLNQKFKNTVKGFLIFIGLVVGFYGFLSLLNN